MCRYPRRGPLSVEQALRRRQILVRLVIVVGTCAALVILYAITYNMLQLMELVKQMFHP